MKLLTLTASNIFSIGKVTLDLSDRGLLLITGHSYDEGSANGAGKSSVANKAISWGLYGQTFGGSRADAVINSHNPNEVSFVEINFLGVDNGRYSIRRQRNPAKLSFQNSMLRTDLTQRNEKDTQLLINKALGKDFKTFSHTDFFGQGRTESFFSVAPADQKQIIENILPMDKLSQWADNCKKVRAKLNTGLDEIKERKIKSEAYLNALEQQRNSLHNNSIGWRAQHETKIKNAKDSILKAEGNQAESDGKVKEVQDQINELNKETYRDALIIKSYTDAFSTDIETLNKSINENEKQIAVWEANTKFNDNQLRQLRFDGNCTVCYQPISSEVSKKKQEEIETILSGLEISIYKLRANTLEKKNKLFELEKIKSGLVKESDSVHNYTTTLNLLENKLKVLNSNQHSSMLQIYQENLKTLETETNPYEEMLSSIIKQYETKKSSVAHEKENLNVMEKEIALVKLWEDGYSYDIKNMMIEQACPFLEERTNQYMQDLNNPQIRATFSTVKVLKSGESRDEFNITVSSTTGGNEFDLFSGGEQQLTSFACGMALADLASSQAEGSSEILILDEPFMGLSSKNCENVINFLTQTISNRKSTILLISNEDELKSLIPQSIHVVKRDGTSAIEVV